MDLRSAGHCGVSASAWLHLAAGAAAAAAVPWFSTWLLARTAEPAIVGQYGLAMAWLSPLFVVGGLQLRPLLATATDGDRLLQAYLRLRAAGLLTVLCLVGGVALTVGGDGQFGLVLATAALAKVAELLSDFSYGWLTRRTEFRRVGASQLLRATTTVTVFSACWLLKGSLPLAFLLSGLAALAITLWNDETSIARAARGTLSPANVATPFRGAFLRHCEELRILQVALPLAGVMFLNHGIVASPRLWLGQLRMMEELAALTALMSLMAVPALLATAYAASLSPQFAAAFQQDGLAGFWSRLRTASRSVLLAAIPGLGFLVLAGDSALRSLFGDPYAVGTATLAGAAWFSLTWALAAVYGTAATAARRVWPQIIAFALGLVVSAVSAWLLIPDFGAAGAAWSLGAAGSTVLLVYEVAFRLIPWSPGHGAVGRHTPLQEVSAGLAYRSADLEPIKRQEVISDVH